MTTIASIAGGNRVLLVSFSLWVLMCSTPHSGFMIIFFAAPALLYQRWMLAHSWQVQEEKLRRVGALVIISLGIVVVTGFHLYYRLDSRRTANRLVEEVNHFKSTYGRYPASVTELNDAAFWQKHPYKLAYISDKGNPVLFYGATFVPFEQWEFDFSAKAWKYVQD